MPRNETLKRIAEVHGNEAALAFMREEKLHSRRRELEGIRLGGMSTVGVGLGLIVFLHQLDPDSGVFWVGLIPLLVGAAMLVHVFLAENQ